MRRFQRILYVSQATQAVDGLTQALNVARDNSASVHVLVLYPAIPAGQTDLKTLVETALRQQLQNQLTQKQAELGYTPQQPVQIEFASGHGQGVAIVRHVLRESFDLVVKEASSRANGTGLQAVDMDLLRKCPCPVWLSRPIRPARQQIRVAVAIDPETETPVERDLAMELLKLSRSLADTCDGTLRIISCWQCEFEHFMRNSAWSQMSEEQVQGMVWQAQSGHSNAVQEIIKASGIGGDIALRAERGSPADVIPALVRTEDIDVLVMGTVARTGIPGFIMGNTAENVVQELKCSLLTLKPRGFVSPVSGY